MFTTIKLLKLILDKKDSQKVANILLENELILATAESCTGGLISSLMTDIPGSSSFIKSNFVTYANEAKTKYLSVSETTLTNNGAVSKQTAKEMAEGLLKTTNADIALVTTGIAGPTGGTKQKPVGLVYIGIAKKNKETCIFKFNTNPKYPRILIKYIFAKQAIKLLAKNLEEHNK